MSVLSDKWDDFNFQLNAFCKKGGTNHGLPIALVPADKLTEHLKFCGKKAVAPEGYGWYMVVNDATTYDTPQVLIYGPHSEWEDLYSECLADCRDGYIKPLDMTDILAKVLGSPKPKPSPTPTPLVKPVKKWGSLF